MFKYRIISFPLLFAIFFIVVLSEQYGPWLFMGLAPLMLGMLVWEVLKMLPGIGLAGYPRLTAFFAVLLAFFPLAFNFPLNEPGLLRENMLVLLATTFAAIPGIGALLILIARDYRDAVTRCFVSAGVLYAALALYLPLVLLYTGNTFGPLPGMRLFFYLVIVTKMMDTGGYIVGKLSSLMLKGGNHKIVPSISPGKSYEGTAGGLLFSLTAAWLFYRFGGSPFDLTWTMISGAALAIGSFAGDLTESAIKRACGVKDSNSLIPGMGGVFDVLDSFLYNGWLYFLLLGLAA